ncbi:unnamed protein product [Mesocestoides corti]|uniref:Transcription initiation factor TFIID subunit 12 n=1 Tax=Mesocestoides corti TaxID=53468 RepID=A0A0R3URF0_MESCO|nr:unnamed protein product [Mesocestoides corti]
MNGSNEQGGEPPLQQQQQQQIPASLSTVTSTPELSGVMSVSCGQPVWTQQQVTTIVPAPGQAVFVQGQQQNVSSTAPIVLAPTTTTLNGPFVAATGVVGSTDNPPTPQLNGVIPQTDSTPKVTSLQTGETVSASSKPATSSPLAQQVPNNPAVGETSQHHPPVFNTKSLTELVKETDPYLQLDDETEEALTILSEEFVESVAKQAVKMAAHRNSSVVEARDVKFCLDRDWNIFIPGFPVVEKNFKRPFILQAHKQRLALVKKQIKRS